jgi:hypothetical protein
MPDTRRVLKASARATNNALDIRDPDSQSFEKIWLFTNTEYR